MLCRRGEYLLFSLRALERLAGLQQDFAAVRLARNVTEYRLTSLNLSVKRGTVNR